mgnify:FL=1|jgi:hypothetical protein
MNNLLSIDWNAGGELAINVKDVYRVDQKAGATDSITCYYNIASDSGPKVWAVDLKFSSNVIDADVTQLQAAVLRIQQSPNAMVKFKMPSEAKLDTTTPFAFTAGGVAVPK